MRPLRGWDHARGGDAVEGIVAVRNVEGDIYAARARLDHQLPGIGLAEDEGLGGDLIRGVNPGFDRDARRRESRGVRYLNRGVLPIEAKGLRNLAGTVGDAADQLAGVGTSRVVGVAFCSPPTKQT